MRNEFKYDLEEYPLKRLFPLHWILEINKQDIVDRIECVIIGDQEQCKKIDEKLCSVYDERG